jgi:phenylpyruvate tautomerase PptA (4-oxalocrotonate tautomerase family)
MPLVHIHVIESRRTREELRHVADTIQNVMLEHFAAPDRDRPD